MSLTLGEFYYDEDLVNEHKALHLNSEVIDNMETDTIYQIMKNGKWTQEFSEIVRDNHIHFIGQVLPKYFASYSNAKIDGCINYGVDDTSEISGIAIRGELPRNEIWESIKNNMEQYLDSIHSIDEIMSRIEIEYIPLVIDESILTDDAERYWQDFSNNVIDYNDLVEEYLEQQALFLIRHRKYTQKLEKMLNITKYRKELAEFIRLENGSEQLIDELIGDGKTFIKLLDDNIISDRENPHRMFYWIARFRTIKSKENVKTKPLKPLHPSIYYPSQILANLPCMRLRFLKNNPDINYYMIRVKCRTKDLGDGVKFMDRCSKKWLYRTRVETMNIDNGPMCIYLGDSDNNI